MFDVAIIGGGAAGLSAGLILGRFRRKVIICDSGKPRNAPAQGVHGFLSRDGIPPQQLLAISREQLQPYDTVELRHTEVVNVVRNDQHFDIIFSDASRIQATTILLATGVKDELPTITGLSALWGKSVFHCPYCHGWEARDQQIAILANGSQAEHLAMLLRALSDDIVICTNGDSNIDAEASQHLADLGIRIIPAMIQDIKGDDDKLKGIAFADGQYLPREAIFVATDQHQHAGLPAALGCAFTEHGFVQVNEQGMTTVEGVYAAGDNSTPMQQVLFAAASGAKAAAFINSQLAQNAFAKAH